MKEPASYRRIPVAAPALIGNEKKYVNDCLDSNWISSNGSYINRFEEAFAQYIGVRYAIACCNGTAALHLALLALGVGPGDEVIVPTLTYVATANAVVYTGAAVVLADCEAGTWNMDSAKLELLISPRTKAIVAVPLYGHPCDMDPILALAWKHGLFVVEDAAEALGGRYNGKLCGSMADISTFSFYGNKTITTGEGGMVVTNDAALAAKARLFMGQGMDPQRRYWFPVIGYNYRMTNIEAAIGLAQLENIDGFLLKRRSIAALYNNNLAGIAGITLPIEADYADHSYWMYSILVEENYGRSRDETMAMLAESGIETRPFFYPMHDMPVYGTENDARLSTASQIASKGINLPTFYSLSKDEIEFIAAVLKSLICPQEASCTLVTS